jgi:hypothetical protein
VSLSRPPNHAKCFLINSTWVAIAVTAVRFFRSIAEINLVVAGKIALRGGKEVPDV